MRQLKITPSPTNRTEAIEKYLQDINRNSVLISQEEEIQLTRLIKKGDIAARNKLAIANLRFVVSVAKQYQSQAPLNDLINEGNMGLIKAAQRFDETRGFKFISYAVWWIRQEILQFIGETRTIIRTPGNHQNVLRKYNDFVRVFENKNGRQPTESETLEALDITEESYFNIIYNTSSISMDAKFSEDETGTLHDVIADTENGLDGEMSNESVKIETNRILKALSSKERDILEKYYGIGHKEPYTLNQIGEELGMCGENVRRIRDKALAKLRHRSNISRFKNYCTN
mgnify:CR=1 FL=1